MAGPKACMSTPDNGNLVVRPGKLLEFHGRCCVLLSMHPLMGSRYYETCRLLALVLACDVRRQALDTNRFALCLLQGTGLCWISHTSLYFLDESV